MAYAALISLKLVIRRLLHSSHILILPPNPQLKSVNKDIISLQKFLTKNFSSESERVAVVDRRMRDAIHNFENLLESYVSDQFLSQYGSGNDVVVLDLQNMDEEMQVFMETVNKIKEEYSIEAQLLRNSLFEEVDHQTVSSRIEFIRNKTDMVGLTDELFKLKDRLTDENYNFQIVPIVGMAGIGKTTLVKQVYEDPFIVEQFDCRLWVKVGPKCKLNSVLLCILAHFNLNIENKKIDDIKDIAFCLETFLSHKRFLIVLDDVWDKDMWNGLRKYLPIPNTHGRSRVVLTTRLAEVAKLVWCHYRNDRIRFLNKEESWDLLRQKVFGNESCPRELEKVGKKIAENCEGLPLAIITVANHLAEKEKSLEYWTRIAEDENSDFLNEDDAMLEVLRLSYKMVPQRLRAYFLYMGVFSRKCEIPASKLFELWIAEGFLEYDSFMGSKYDAMNYLDELVSSSLVLVQQESSSGGIKTCRFHYAFRHFCMIEARKDKFFQVLNRYPNSFGEAIRSQHRVSVQKHVLLGLKEVYNSMRSISTVRSVLCTGSNHPFALRFLLEFRYLRVLDAIVIRFHVFPVEVLNLVLLRYLSLTSNHGELPGAISKLWNLQYLIVRRHLCIKSTSSPTFMPMEIWKMKELRRLQVMGSDLPDPSNATEIDDLSLPNLETLTGVSAYSCRKEILERIPRLVKLGVRIELMHDSVLPIHVFDHLYVLTELESFKCAILNPRFGSQIIALPDSSSTFPPLLRKLTLSGCGFSWGEMKIFAALHQLDVLKLRFHAFRGPMWELLNSHDFMFLTYILLEDLDVEHWRGDNILSFLNRLVVRHCYRLKEIPLKLGCAEILQKIELVDCSPSALDSAFLMEKGEETRGSYELQIRFLSSLDKDDHKKITIRALERFTSGQNATGASQALSEASAELSLSNYALVRPADNSVAERRPCHFRHEYTCDSLWEKFEHMGEQYMAFSFVLNVKGVVYDPHCPGAGNYPMNDEYCWEALKAIDGGTDLLYQVKPLLSQLQYAPKPIYNAILRKVWASCNETLRKIRASGSEVIDSQQSQVASLRDRETKRLLHQMTTIMRNLISQSHAQIKSCSSR